MSTKKVARDSFEEMPLTPEEDAALERFLSGDSPILTKIRQRMIDRYNARIAAESTQQDSGYKKVVNA